MENNSVLNMLAKTVEPVLHTTYFSKCFSFSCCCVPALISYFQLIRCCQSYCQGGQLPGGQEPGRTSAKEDKCQAMVLVLLALVKGELVC